MEKYYWERAKWCLVAHRVYERTDNPNKSKFLFEVKGEELARFATDAMNAKDQGK